VVRRAQIILFSAAGDSNTAIADRLKLSLPTIGLWRERYHRLGLAALYGEARPGRPRSHDDERVAVLLTKTLRTRPRHATHWSVRQVAKETGIPKSTVQRYLSLFGVQPHRQRSFKLSTDPFFVEKIRDVVGLYLNPPENALVLCVDERARFRRWNGRSPCCRWGWGMSKASPMTIVAMGPRRSLRPSM
jgi:transposase